MMKIISKIAYILFLVANTLYFGFARSELDNIDCTFFGLSFVGKMPDTSYSIICEEIWAKESEEDKGNDFHSKEVKNKGELW